MLDRPRHGPRRDGARFAQGLQLVVPDIEAARAELVARGVEVGDIQRMPWGAFVFFSDPDGNGWAVQELPSAGGPGTA